MPPRLASLAASLFVLAIAGAPIAHAQMYKWVDERGVTNYSNEPPPKGVTAQRVGPVQDRMSTYSPPPSTSASTGASQPDAMRERVQELERQLEQERRLRGSAVIDDAERRKRAYDECIRARAVDCDAILGQAPLGVEPAVVFVPTRAARIAPTVPLRDRDARPRIRPTEPERDDIDTGRRALMR